MSKSKRTTKPQHRLFIVTVHSFQDVVSLHCASPDQATALRRFANTTTTAEKDLGIPDVIDCTTRPEMRKHFKYDGYLYSDLRH